MESVKRQHTPGPWIVFANSPDADGSERLPSVMAKNPLGGMFYVAQFNSKDDAIACAALPELLAVAEEIASDSRCDLFDSERRIRLYHAIAKARGEARP